MARGCGYGRFARSARSAPRPRAGSGGFCGNVVSKLYDSAGSAPDAGAASTVADGRGTLKMLGTPGLRASRTLKTIPRNHPAAHKSVRCSTFSMVLSSPLQCLTKERTRVTALNAPRLRNQRFSEGSPIGTDARGPTGRPPILMTLDLLKTPGRSQDRLHQSGGDSAERGEEIA